MSQRRLGGYYFEELTVGDSFDCGGITVTEDAIIRFAMEWDMQSFHVDGETAQGSLFKGLVGSGLQSVMLCYRLYFQKGLLDGTALAGLGIDEIRFHNPLRPGTTLHVQAIVDALRLSSNPSRGIITWKLVASTAGLIILTMKLTALMACKPASDI